MSTTGDPTAEIGNKEVQKTALLTQLRSIKGERLDPFSATYPFTNDRNIAPLIPDIKAHQEGASAKLKAGMVIGTGGLLTLGKELPDIDIWIVVDRRTSMIDALQSWEDYIVRTLSFDRAKNVTFTPEAQAYYNLETESYGSYHYFASQQEYDATRDFLSKKKIAYVPGDLLDEQFMHKVGNALQQYGAKITFANMTNVMQWVMKDTQGDINFYGNRLAGLPFDDNCYFLYSTQDVSLPE